MKRSIPLIVIILIISGLGYFLPEMVGFANSKQEEKSNLSNPQQNNIEIYFVDLPPGLDTLEFKATITLDPNKKIHKLKFPNGGTETSVLIYDSSYLKAIQSNSIPKINPLLKGNFNHDQEVLLDITALQRGSYYVHYLSCNLGGVFPLTIK